MDRSQAKTFALEMREKMADENDPSFAIGYDQAIIEVLSCLDDEQRKTLFKKYPLWGDLWRQKGKP